jgi:hypothetical protein
MSRHEQQWTYIERGDNSRITTRDTDVMLAIGLSVEDAKYIVELHNREHKFQSQLKPATYNAYPFVVEALERDGEMARYRVSRKGVGGVYSDELLVRKDAELTAHRLEREEASNEQLRYRIWQLEQVLNAAREMENELAFFAKVRGGDGTLAEVRKKLQQALEKAQ